MAYPMREMPKRPAACDKHGAFESINFASERWSGCPQCASEEREAQKTAADLALKRDRIESRIRWSGLEGRFKDATFDDFDAATSAQQKVLNACREYARDFNFTGGGGLWLIGPPGTGKTHLGSAMVRYVIEERDAAARIHSAREMVRMIRSTWGNREHGRGWDGQAITEEDMLYDFGHASLLVIDEIGVGFGSEAEQVQLFDIIDARYKHRRPTVLLSNLPAKDLKTALGERAYDRLREGSQILVCQWESHRGGQIRRAPLEAVK